MSRRSWTADEDHALSVAVAKYGAKSWKRTTTYVKDRDHSQCLQRWRKTLDPTLIKGFWSKEKDQQLMYLVTTNPRAPWAKIASQIPGRFIRQCRDRWNTALNPSAPFRPATALYRLHQKPKKFLWPVASGLHGTRHKNKASSNPGRKKVRWPFVQGQGRSFFLGPGWCVVCGVEHPKYLQRAKRNQGPIAAPSPEPCRQGTPTREASSWYIRKRSVICIAYVLMHWRWGPTRPAGPVRAA
jgi:hypothetical protein